MPGRSVAIGVISWVAVALAFAAGTASGHEYWLSPSRYQAAAGDKVSIGALVGTGFRGDPRPYAAPRSVRFVVAAARTVDLTPAALNGEIPWATFVMPDDQGAVVAYQSNFADIELPAAEFDAYLELEGLDGPRAARAKQGAAAGPGRERYARCPKLWIAGPVSAVKARIVASIGLPIEIVPLADPATVATLPVRVLWHGKPLAGALVRAWNTNLAEGWAPRAWASRDSVGPAASARTDKNGEARIAIAHPGEWLITSEIMEPCAEKSEADWESWWASFTFARAGK
jgi:uncharacterized GH25 family protein